MGEGRGESEKRARLPLYTIMLPACGAGTSTTDRRARSRASSSSDTPRSTDTPRTHPNKKRRTRGGVSESRTSYKTAWLFDIPSEVAALAIKHCQPRDFAALCVSSRALHPLIEQALMLRTVEQGHALPQVLPTGEECCHDRVQAILALERRRAQLGRTISAGMSHSLFVSPEGARKRPPPLPSLGVSPRSRS